MEREVGFDIEDTWLYMGLLAQREEAEVTRYIQAKRGQALHHNEVSVNRTESGAD